MSGSLDHALIQQLFDELSDALEARGVRGHIYLLGGGALIAGHGKERSTKDLDVRIDAATDEVIAVAKTIGERHGLDERWFDVTAAQFVPGGEDIRAKTVYNSPGLVVTGASAKHLLAMKVFAARDIDLQDVKHLAGVLGITKASDAIRTCEQAYPGWHVLEKTRRQVEHAIADAREERGEPVPELTLERNTTLRADGANGRRYEITAQKQADDSETLHVTVHDPQAPDYDDERPVRTVYGAPRPIRTLEAANTAVNEYEHQAQTRDGMPPRETPVELKPVEVLRAEGERGRRYRAEWIRSGGATGRLDVSVTDPSTTDQEQGAHERVLQRATGDRVVRTIEQANEVINRYEQEAGGNERENPRKATLKAMEDHPEPLETRGGANAPDGATRPQRAKLPDKSKRDPDRTNYPD